MSFNTSVQMLTLVWNEKRFVESKSARNAARRSVFRAATIMLNSDSKALDNQNDEIRHEINRCRHDLHKYDDKLQVLDNMTQLATQSLEVYFQARMENLRTFVTEQCRVISDGIQEEADHWKEIHAMLQQKLVVPGDLRSYGGGNGLPRAVRQSPNFSQIPEADEEEEEEKKADMSTLLQSRTLTPLLTQTLKKARLLASKLSQDASFVIPPPLNISGTVHEETVIEDPPSTSIVPETHVTLRDVSVIEKEIEADHNPLNPDLSVSLLPYLPTANLEEDEEEKEEEEQQQHQENNKSIASTISDKTFVKTSLKPFSSEEETDDDTDEDDDTIIEDSLVADNTENARPLLLTADRSIRRPILTPLREERHSPSHQSNVEQPKIKQEKVSFREPLPVEHNCSNRTILLNNNTFDTDNSNHVRPSIFENANTTKLPTILSEESNEEESANVTFHSENKPIEEPKVIEPIPIENRTNRRTTRRKTTRLFRDSQNDNLPSQAPIELPVKTRYATRYSTRLAATVVTEEKTTTTAVHRRTTRFTSE